jgi:exo-beta-1,3-glucanase (GH17 family)
MKNNPAPVPLAGVNDSSGSCSSEVDVWNELEFVTLTSSRVQTLECNHLVTIRRAKRTKTEQNQKTETFAISRLTRDSVVFSTR